MIIDEFLDPLKHLLHQFTTLEEEVSFIHVYIIYTNGHPNIHNVPDKCVCSTDQCAIHGYVYL